MLLGQSNTVNAEFTLKLSHDRYTSSENDRGAGSKLGWNKLFERDRQELGARCQIPVIGLVMIALGPVVLL